jgi:opacity protein-like surface antigen
MRPKVLLSAAAAALVLAACAADSTGPGTPRQPAPPRAEGGNGQFGSGGYTAPPPPDSTHP